MVYLFDFTIFRYYLLDFTKAEKMENTLKDFKKILPHGYAKRIAFKLKTSVRRVYNVVYGIVLDDLIELEILQLIEERKRIISKKEEIKQRLAA